MKKRLLSICITSALLSMTAGNAVADLDEGLVAYYPFNGNALDASGNENHGTVYGVTLTADQFGNSESAYRFDGTDDYINAGHETGNLVDELTISAWINPFSTNSSWPTIVAKWSGISSNELYTFGLYNHKVYGEATTSSRMIYRQTDDNHVILHEWQYLSMTYDSDTHTLKLYQNGEVVQGWIDVNYGQIDTFNSDLTIGIHKRERLLHPFHGIIDEVRIYSRALSDCEIQSLYKGTDECVSDGELTQADIDAAQEAGKQACIDDPSSCGIPSEGTCEPATLSSGFKMHIPLLNYTPLAGDESAVMPLWVDMNMVDANNLQFKVTDYGVIE